MSRRAGKKPAKEVEIIEISDDDEGDAPFAGVGRGPSAPDDGDDVVCDYPGENMEQTPKEGRHCRQVDFGGTPLHCCRNCGAYRVWKRNAAKESKGCIESDNGEGACCVVNLPPEKYDRSYQTPWACVDGKVRQVFVSKKGKEAFPAATWGRYDIDGDGDCFYNAVSKAVNSETPPAGHREMYVMTVHKLRWASAMHVRPGSEFAARRDFYAGAAPDHLKLQYMRTRRASELQEMMLHPDHWATMIDVLDVFNNRDLDVIPIVLNANYGQKTSGGEAVHALMNPLTVHYGATKARMAELRGSSSIRFIMLLYGGRRVGPHFELVVNKAKKKTWKGKEFYNTLFSIDEIPDDALESFGVQLI